MPCMREIHMDFEDVKDCFNDEAFSQEDFFHHWHKIIFHIAPDACDEFESPLIKFLKQVLRDESFICQNRSLKMTGHVV